MLDGKAIEEITNFLEWGGVILGGNHQVGRCWFSDRGFDTRGCFFFSFPAAVLVGAVELDSGFLDLVILLVAVTLGFVGASVTAWGKALEFGLE
jgi:hypothetical protein